MDIFPALVSQYAVQAPLLLVWLGGLFIALGRWQRHPRVSLLTVILCAVLVGESLLGTFFYAWLPGFMLERGNSATTMGLIFAVVGGVRSLIHAALWGLALFIIFRGRAEHSPPAA
jgi:hypothetical protein